MPRYDYACDECGAVFVLKASVANYVRYRDEYEGKKHAKCLTRPRKGHYRRVFSTFTFHMGPA